MEKVDNMQDQIGTFSIDMKTLRRKECYNLNILAFVKLVCGSEVFLEAEVPMPD